jgi:hypothetical protein
MRHLLLLLPLLASPALAQEAVPLDADAFEELVEGRTLAYGAVDAEIPRGIETYAPNRRVTWLEVESGRCVEGEWYGRGTPEAPQICFVYEDEGVENCFLYALQGEVVLSTNLDGSLPEVSLLDVDRDGIACAWLGV